VRGDRSGAVRDCATKSKQLARAHSSSRTNLYLQLVPERLRGIDDGLILRPLQDGLVRLPSLWPFQFPTEILDGFQKRVAMEHHGPRILTRKLVEPVLEFHPVDFSQRLIAEPIQDHTDKMRIDPTGS
jgi:hypothetical protein